MRFIKKLLVRWLGFELLAPEVLRLLWQGARSLQQELYTQAAKWVRRSVWLVLVLLLFSWSLFFGLCGLSLYLNILLGSSYLGFLWVAAGCLGCSALLLLLRR